MGCRDWRQRLRAAVADADRPVDVLDRYLSAVLEPDVDAIADAFIDNRGYADTARLGERLEARGDIDAIAVMSSPSMITSPRLMPIRSTIAAAR